MTNYRTKTIHEYVSNTINITQLLIRRSRELPNCSDSSLFQSQDLLLCQSIGVRSRLSQNLDTHTKNRHIAYIFRLGDIYSFKSTTPFMKFRRIAAPLKPLVEKLFSEP